MTRALLVLVVAAAAAGCRDATTTPAALIPAGPSAAPVFSIVAPADALCPPAFTARSVPVTQQGDFNHNGVVCDLAQGPPHRPHILTLDDIVAEVAP